MWDSEMVKHKKIIFIVLLLICGNLFAQTEKNL